MMAANNSFRIRCTFFFLFLFFTLLSLFSAFADEKITTVHLGDQEISDITSVFVRSDGKIVIYSGSAPTVADPGQLPPVFLSSWGINPGTIQDTVEGAKEKSFERAFAAGEFRVVDGVVYDLRRSQSGWVMFRNVRMLMKLGDDEAILDTTPDSLDTVPIHVVHFPQANYYGDQDRFNFTGMLAGNFTFKAPRIGQRTIRTYDAGRLAERDEIPDAILKEGKSYAALGPSEAPRSSVVANLPQADKLYDSGTAFFITDDGYLITNDHVIRGVHKVRIKTKDQFFDAKVVKTDKQADLALLKVEGNSFTALSLASTKGPELGADVFTIGFPNIDVQGFEPKYTDGKISSLAGIRDDPTTFQVSVPIQPGNSGGPLLSRYGSVDGVMEARLNDAAIFARSGTMPENVNYAIKVSSLREFLKPIHELDGKLKTQSGSSRKRADVLKRAQEAVVMVLGYK